MEIKMIEEALLSNFNEIDKVCFINQKKVLKAFQ